MNTQPNQPELALSSNQDLDYISREIVRIFTLNEQFEAALLNDNSPESQLYNLALRYLDSHEASKREAVGRTLQSQLAKYATQSKRKA